MMDIITMSPRTAGVDSIYVIVYRLTKSALFIPIQERISTEMLAEIYMRKVVA